MRKSEEKGIKMEEIERRSFRVEELRAVVAGDESPKISGYAAVFNKLSEDLGGFQEKIAPGAFAKSLLKADVRALWNHDPNYPLGRSKAGTLTLAEDQTGLQFAIDPPDTQYARDLITSMKRGDVDQMSFGFRTIKDQWEENGNKVTRTLLEVDLYDVSPVTYPAYPQTSAQVRSAFESFTTVSQEAADGAEEEAKSKVRLANRKRKLEIESIKLVNKEK